MLKYGDNNIGRVIFGSNEIGKAYIGSNLVFSQGITPVDVPVPANFLFCENNAYIDTGVIPTNNTRVICDFQQYPIGPDYQYLFGGRTAYQSKDYTFTSQRMSSYRPNMRYSLGSAAYNMGTSYDFIRLDKCRIDYNNGGLVTVTDLERTASASYDFGTPTAFTGTYSIYLFGLNDAGSVGGRAYAKIYECWIYQGEELVRHFVPYRLGNIGFMRDTVSGQDFYSASENSFIPDKYYTHETKIQKVVPSGYTQGRYLYWSNNNFLTLDFYPNQDTKVVADIIPGGSATAWSHLYGARVGYASSDYSFSPGNNSTSAVRFVYGSEGYAGDALIPGLGRRMIVTQDKNHATIVNQYDGTTLLDHTFSEQTFAPGCKFMLGTYNDNGTHGNNYFLYGTLYSFKIYDNGTLAHDLVPAKRDSDNKVGLYDVVKGTFLTFGGTGSPTLGPAI